MSRIPPWTIVTASRFGIEQRGPDGCNYLPLTNSTVTVRRAAFAATGGYDPTRAVIRIGNCCCAGEAVPHRLQHFGTLQAEVKAWRKAGNLPGGLHMLPGYFMGCRKRHLLEQGLDQLPATTSAE